MESSPLTLLREALLEGRLASVITAVVQAANLDCRRTPEELVDILRLVKWIGGNHPLVRQLLHTAGMAIRSKYQEYPLWRTGFFKEELGISPPTASEACKELGMLHSDPLVKLLASLTGIAYYSCKSGGRQTLYFRSDLPLDPGEIHSLRVLYEIAILYYYSWRTRACSKTIKDLLNEDKRNNNFNVNPIPIVITSLRRDWRILYSCNIKSDRIGEALLIPSLALLRPGNSLDPGEGLDIINAIRRALESAYRENSVREIVESLALLYIGLTLTIICHHNGLPSKKLLNDLLVEITLAFFYAERNKQ